MSQLQKAKLISQDDRSEIVFMFNPTELDFQKETVINNSEALRDRDGLNKVSFGGPKPLRLSIGNVIFDTYESGDNVMTKYVDKLLDALEFVPNLERPPIYLFTWGQIQYMRCFILSVGYKLTLFLADGTPVRATANLSMIQTEQTR